MILQYKHGWKTIFRKKWLVHKVLNLDMQGLTFSRVQKIVDTSEDLKAFRNKFIMMGGTSNHTTAYVMIPDDNGIDTFTNVNEAMDAVDELMKTHSKVLVDFGYESYEEDGGIDQHDTGGSLEIIKEKIVLPSKCCTSKCRSYDIVFNACYDDRCRHHKKMKQSKDEKQKVTTH